MRKCIFIISTLASLTIFASSAVSGDSLTLKSKNDIDFKAVFFKAESPNSPALLILPGMSGRRDPYQSFSKKLNAAGFNVLVTNYAVMDKVSKSAKHKEKKRALNKRGGTMGIVDNEVTASINFLRTQESVDKNRIGILGGSMGTWVGFQSMAKFQDVKCLIMLSPICAVSGKSFKTYDGTKDLADAFGNRHLFLVASESDRHSSKSPSAVEKSDYLISIMPNAKIEKKYYSGKSHSYFILRDHSEVQELLITWLQKEL